MTLFKKVFMVSPSDQPNQAGILRKFGIARDKVHGFGDDLGNEHPVKWIPMMKGQGSHRFRMLSEYGEFDEAAIQRGLPQERDIRKMRPAHLPAAVH